MPFILQTSTSSNARQRAEVQIAAYANDVLTKALCIKMTDEQRVAFFLQLIPQDDGETKPWIRGQEIWDTDTQRVAAFTKWKYPTSDKTSETEEKNTSTSFDDIVLPPEIDKALFKAMMTPMEEFGKKYHDPENYYLDSMCVHPDYQRRGLARLLLEPILKEADKQGKKVNLLASDQGRIVYEKLGFNVLEEKVWDFTEYGATGTRRSTAMSREVSGGLVV